MSDQAERYAIFGRATPYGPDNEIVPLAEISIVDWRLEVGLTEHPLGQFSCSCEIWEHTIYEMENLSEALRAAAAGPFPPEFSVPRPESQIGTAVNLFPTIGTQVGYSLKEPGDQRAKFFCSSAKSAFCL